MRLIATILFLAAAPAHHHIQRVEHAITWQINRQVAPLWNTPRVWFAQHPQHADVLVLVESPQAVAQQCKGDGLVGCHWDSGGTIVLAVDRSHDWTQTLSHELIEGLADPTQNAWLGGMLREPCDPVNGDVYQHKHVDLADFVLPAWYTAANGPWDEMRMTHAAGRFGADGYAMNTADQYVGPGR